MGTKGKILVFKVLNNGVCYSLTGEHRKRIRSVRDRECFIGGTWTIQVVQKQLPMNPLLPFLTSQPPQNLLLLTDCLAWRMVLWDLRNIVGEFWSYVRTGHFSDWKGRLILRVLYETQSVTMHSHCFLDIKTKYWRVHIICGLMAKTSLLLRHYFLCLHHVSSPEWEKCFLV